MGRGRIEGAFLGLVLAAATATAAPVAAQGQVTCAQGTGSFLRAVGNSAAPLLVPLQVPLTICSQDGVPIAVIPAFRTVGPGGAPMIIPVPSTVKTCAPVIVATSGGSLTSIPVISSASLAAIPVVSSSSSGAMPVISSTSLGSTPAPLVVTNPGAVGTTAPVVVTTSPVVLTCF